MVAQCLANASPLPCCTIPLYHSVSNQSIRRHIHTTPTPSPRRASCVQLCCLMYQAIHDVVEYFSILLSFIPKKIIERTSIYFQ